MPEDTDTNPAIPGDSAPNAPEKPNEDERDIGKQPVWVQEIIRSLRRENADHRTKARQAEEARLAEEGKYKELFEQRDRELATLKSQLEREARDKLALSVAVAVGLPPEAASRLRGTTEDELRADAEAFKALLPKPKAPDTEGGAGTGTSRQTTAQEYERVKEAARASGRYGL